MNTTEKIRKRHTSYEKAQLIREFKDSGMTKKEWCDTQNITVDTLRIWLNHEKQMQPVQQWVPVTVGKEPIAASGLVLQIGKCTITVPEDSNLDFATSVLEMVAKIC